MIAGRICRGSFQTIRFMRRVTLFWNTSTMETFSGFALPTIMSGITESKLNKTCSFGAFAQ